MMVGNEDVLFNKDEKVKVTILFISFVTLMISLFGRIEWPYNIDPAWIAIVFCGIPIIIGAAKAIVTELDITADLLVSLALFASVYIGEYFAAGEVALIMSVGAFLEELTVAKAQLGIDKLIQLKPKTARLIKDGSEKIVAAESIKINDRLKVIAGETIPADGEIILGTTSVDQAIMTGESIPVDKTTGDFLMSGTINQYGTIEMIVTKNGEDSSIQRMVQLVESTDANKAKIVGIADRWAVWIVIVALSAAIATFLVTHELIRSVTILVVFCPCSLVLATPTAIVAGIGNVTKYGALVHEGDALERLAKVKRILFDKTGTITIGKPSVAAVVTVADLMKETDFLQSVASLEASSEHPLGKSIVTYAKEKNIELFSVADCKVWAGKGISGYQGYQYILAGNEKLLLENNIVLADLEHELSEKYIENGCTLIYVAINNRYVGFIALADTLRKESAATIKKIKQNGVKCTLLTGDNRHSAAFIADQAGMDEFEADCLPERKLEVVKKYADRNEKVCMLGDGVNDAPALKAAAVGIAMGGIGSDIAMEAADIVLVRDEIRNIPHLLALSKRMMKKIHFNLFFSMSLNFVAIILAITGVFGPVVGALVHNSGSVFVIVNSALLLNWKGKNKQQEI